MVKRADPGERALPLAGSLCYLRKAGQVVGMDAAEGKILPLFQSRDDAQRWAEGAGVPGGPDSSIRRLDTVGDRSDLLDYVDQYGWNFVAINPPYEHGVRFDMGTPDARFEHELREARKARG